MRAQNTRARTRLGGYVTRGESRKVGPSRRVASPPSLASCISVAGLSPAEIRGYSKSKALLRDVTWSE